MENTMTTSGDVDTTVAMTRVFHQPSVLCDTPVRRLAAPPAPFQGTSLPVAGRYAGPVTKGRLAGVAARTTTPASTPATATTPAITLTISTMDAPFRAGRPPV
jgi:hypothetical protein